MGGLRGRRRLRACPTCNESGEWFTIRAGPIVKPRVFVVMPFGKKRHEANDIGYEIDFDAVYCDLLAPALGLAGCDPYRADSEAAAGDIRTDMFFELVTADLVVADISITDPNVFYELGVRHGVCPRGVLVVQGSLEGARPFDVAPDRSFSYDGSLFVSGKCGGDREGRLKREVERLAKTFRHGLAEEPKTTGSPVYQHLPGLIPVNWDNIQTSKANYFGALRDDWLDCVRIAQSEGHPGDIKTLADDAPTILHRTRILYQAALALIDLCRYRAAERELREVIEHDPSHFDAQLQLGLVLAHQGKNAQAELQLRNVLRQHEDDPNAADQLGQVSRHLWHLSWREEKNVEARKQKAVIASQQAALAVRSFVEAQQLNPRAYFAGFNALILIALLKDLRESTGCDLPEIWPAGVDEAELATVVQFCAKNFRERAIEKGDAVEQFQTTTTLSGIALLQNDKTKVLRRIHEACSIPGATFFQLHTFQERLLLCDELDFRPEFVKPALDILGEALAQKNRHRNWKRVFLWAGYPVDSKDQLSPRFPADRVDVVEQQIEEALEGWKVGEGDLAICEGVHEGDILFAEACHNRKAQVRLLLLEPAGGQFHRTLWPFESEKWERRFHELRAALGEEVWFHAEHLGSAFDDSTVQGRQSLERRHKNWLINTARLEAEPAQTSEEPPDFAGRLNGLFLWNGAGDADNPEDPAYFVRLVDEFNGYQGQVKTITALDAPAGAPRHMTAGG
jgi:tetratricopeptide (TPR) repeat protein